MTQTVEEIIARAMSAQRNARRINFDEGDLGLLSVDHEDANAVRNALTAAGFAIVPVEPTEEMVGAAEEADEHATEANLAEGGPGRGLYSDGIWRAMLQASPGYQADALKGK